MSIVFEVHNTLTLVKCQDPGQYKLLYDLLSYEVKGAKYIKRRMGHRAKHWNGYKSFYMAKRGGFLTGLLPQVLSNLKQLSVEAEVVDRRVKPTIPIGPYALDGISLYDYQTEAIEQFLKEGRGITQLATGAGKCLAKGTKVLMFDGTIKKVEDVQIGDQLMGDDSTPRTVLSLAHGNEEMYRVTPVKGEPYVVNKSHVLSLRATGNSIKHVDHYADLRSYTFDSLGTIDIPLTEYLSLAKSAKNVLKGYRVDVNFSSSEVPIDPYFLGLWLGDGRSDGPTICTPDQEIIDYLNQFAKSIGYIVTKYPEPSAADSYGIITASGKSNELKDKLRMLNLLNNKHIPLIYKANSREVRLAVLAGLIDTDGYLGNNYYEIVSKFKVLAEDIAFLARSLGLAAYIKNKEVNGVIYYRTTISGHVDMIPTRVRRKTASVRLQKKNALVTGITVEPIGEGEYFGFTLDGNGRFLLDDFTVTHNTECAIALTKALGVPTLFLTHRIQLLYQMAQRFAKRMPNMSDQIGLIGDSVYEPRRITIATVQTIDSLIKRDQAQAKALLRQYQFLIIDEAHRAKSKQFHLPASLCNEAYYRLAMTATPFMRGDPEENFYLTGISGPIIAKVSATDLIERGILAKPFFKFFPVNTLKLDKLTNWRDVYEQGIIHNEYRNNIIAKQAAKLVASGKKILVIVVEVEHGKVVEKALLNEGLMAKFITGQNTMAERESALNWLRSNNGQVIVATNIFDEGIDVHEINAVILAAGTKSAPALFQRTGRALRNKGDEANFAIIIDFIDYQHGKLLEHSLARYRLIQSEPGFAILG